MSGNKDLMGLVYWMDNSKKARLEAYLEGKREVSKEKRHIMAAVSKERIQKSSGSTLFPSPLK